MKKWIRNWMTGGSGLYSAFIHTVIDVGKAAWFIVLMISDCAVVLLRILRNTDLRSQRKRPPGCKNPQIPCDKIHIIWPLRPSCWLHSFWVSCWKGGVLFRFALSYWHWHWCGRTWLTFRIKWNIDQCWTLLMLLCFNGSKSPQPEKVEAICTLMLMVPKITQGWKI